MAIRIESENTLRQIASDLLRLLDRSPDKAAEQARQLRGTGALKVPTLSLRGAILIEAGGALKDPRIATEGIGIYRKLLKDKGNPARETFLYNLANGLDCIARISLHNITDNFETASWYVETDRDRREARRLWSQVDDQAKDAVSRAKALTNLGNSLDSGFRWVEAYDLWVQALQLDRSNPVSALSIARMLLRRMESDKQHPPSLHRVTGYYARLAARNVESIGEIAGPGGMELAKQLPTFRSSWRPRKLHQIRDMFGRFVAEHRLGLVGTSEGLDLRKKRWDDIHIPKLTESLTSGPGVPPVFAMFNQLKADFCAARWLAFRWDRESLRDTSVYFDTLDYARYGISPSLLTLAQRSAIGVLDRVAVCTNEYLGLGVDRSEIHFRNFWRQGGGVGAWHPYLASELGHCNPGVIALGDLAADLSEGGWLQIHRNIRNVSTHRFLVLHDMGDRPSRESPAVDHYEMDWFRRRVIETLRIARSAILYLRDAIMDRESRTNPEARTVEMLFPHHYIRGED